MPPTPAHVSKRTLILEIIGGIATQLVGLGALPAVALPILVLANRLTALSEQGGVIDRPELTTVEVFDVMEAAFHDGRQDVRGEIARLKAEIAAQGPQPPPADL